jgi:hypothetical protein
MTTLAFHNNSYIVTYIICSYLLVLINYNTVLKGGNDIINAVIGYPMGYYLRVPQFYD